MTAESVGKKIYPWKRYWVRQGENPAMDSGLFVQPMDKAQWFGPQSNGVSLSELNKVPCLILLGDVGMGKSNTVERAATELSNRLKGESHEVLFHDLKRLSESRIEKTIFNDLKVRKWVQGEHSLTLFLDSLDERWGLISDLELLITKGLEELITPETPPLYLRVTCRAAEWRGDAGKSFQRLFSRLGQQAVQTFVLAPLSRQNVLDAAAANLIDGEGLLQRLQTKEAQALASHPITLNMLLDLYKRDGDFPTSRAELYRDGCLLLCTDQHSRFGDVRRKITIPEQRLAIARRIAAISILTNRLLVNGDSERPLGHTDVLESSHIVGSFTERAGLENVVVDQGALMETLQTGLFAERSEGTQTWRHQSYAEFLCAEYLDAQKLTTEQVVTLLTDTRDNSKRIVPQLEETACWTAEIIPAVFDVLALRNADILLRCDSTFWSDAQRAILVESFLDLIRQHHAVTLDWQLKYRFARLAHSGLADQLQPVIADRKEAVLVREAAIDIAGYCKLASVASLLVDIFCDENDAFLIRKHAGIALEGLVNKEIRDSLRARPAPNWSGDVNDDLKGYYLRILWPSHLTLEELLPLSLPKRENYLGSYRMFVVYDLVGSVTDRDLPKLLDWLRESDIGFDILGGFYDFSAKIFKRALSQMDQPAISDAVIRLLKSDEDEHRKLNRIHTDAEEMSADSRINFWKAVVKSDLNINELLYRREVGRWGMHTYTDLPYFLNEYVASAGAERDRWRMLVLSTITRDNAEGLDAICEVARGDHELQEQLAERTSCPLVPEDSNWRKREYLAKVERQRQERALMRPFLPLIERALQGFEDGDLSKFCTICYLLDRDPNSISSISYSIRWSEGKAWNALTPELRKRILSATRVFLEQQPLNESDVWTLEPRCSTPCDILNPTLVLLFDEDREQLDALTKEIWAKWVSAFFRYSHRRNGNNHEAYRAVLSLAFSKAPEASTQALRQYCSTEMNDDSARSILWDLAPVWNVNIEEVFKTLLDTYPLKISAAQEIFELLASHKSKELEHRLAKLVEEPNNPDKSSIFAIAAATTLLTKFPARWGKPLLDRMQADSGFGRAVLKQLLCSRLQASDWLAEIGPKEVLKFWEWLEKEYPGDPYERNTTVHDHTIDHDVYHFRNGVFRVFTGSGEPEAIQLMQDLIDRRPNAFWLGDVLAAMRKTSYRKGWIRPTPSALLASFAKGRRLIRTAGELQMFLVESLERYETELHGAPPVMELWNEVTVDRKKIRQPKDELNFSSCLKRFLERDLEDRGVIADREVQVRQRLGEDQAELVDILVHAVPVGEVGSPGKPVRVVIEVKGAWNQGVMLDMERQLFNRYLRNSELHFGIYVVGYFSCDAWNWDKDDRKRTGESAERIETLRNALKAQADKLSNLEKQVRAVVIDARLNRESGSAFDVKSLPPPSLQGS